MLQQRSSPSSHTSELSRTLVLPRGSLVYRPTRACSAGKVFYLPNVSWAYLSAAAALAAEPELTPVPFFCQRGISILATTTAGLVDMCAGTRPWPRTARSVVVCAARIANRDGHDGIAILQAACGGGPDAVFLLSPCKTAVRVGEAFQNHPGDQRRHVLAGRTPARNPDLAAASALPGPDFLLS